MNPLSTEARINLAYSLQDDGQYMKAWNMFTRTIDINPGKLFFSMKVES